MGETWDNEHLGVFPSLGTKYFIFQPLAIGREVENSHIGMLWMGLLTYRALFLLGRSAC